MSQSHPGISPRPSMAVAPIMQGARTVLAKAAVRGGLGVKREGQPAPRDILRWFQTWVKFVDIFPIEKWKRCPLLLYPVSLCDCLNRVS